MSFITQTLTTFVKGTFLKSIVFKVKNIFEPNVLKLVIKMIFINSLLLLYIYFFYSSMLKSFPIFKRNDAHLVEKKNVCKKQGLSTFKV